MTPQKHWSERVLESIISRGPNPENATHPSKLGILTLIPGLEIRGGAEHGQFNYFTNIQHNKILYHAGKVYSDDLILEINSQTVAGLTTYDLHTIILNSDDPLTIKHVKESHGISKDLRHYLSKKYEDDSIDKNLQDLTRDNLYLRTLPHTTRSPREGEIDGKGYKFITVEEFHRREKNQEFLESGTFKGNWYATPRPPIRPPVEDDIFHQTTSNEFEEIPNSNTTSQISEQQNQNQNQINQSQTTPQQVISSSIINNKPIQNQNSPAGKNHNTNANFNTNRRPFDSGHQSNTSGSVNAGNVHTINVGNSPINLTSQSNSNTNNSNTVLSSNWAQIGSNKNPTSHSQTETNQSPEVLSFSQRQNKYQHLIDQASNSQNKSRSNNTNNNNQKPRNHSENNQSNIIKNNNAQKNQRSHSSSLQNSPSNQDLPLGWELARTSSGHIYYIDHNTQHTSWIHPNNIDNLTTTDNNAISPTMKVIPNYSTPLGETNVQQLSSLGIQDNHLTSVPNNGDGNLPPGWEQIDDPSLGTYYINHITQKTTYGLGGLKGFISHFDKFLK